MSFHENVDWLMVGSLIVNAVLAIVVIIQVYIYRNEINSRLRPWLGRENRIDNIVIEEHTGNSNLIKIHFFNSGSLPGIQIVTRSYADVNVPPTNAFELTTPYPPFSVAPKERWTHRIVINNDELNSARNGVLYYGIRVEYTDKNGVEGLYELRGHWDHGNDTFDSVNIN